MNLSLMTLVITAMADMGLMSSMYNLSTCGGWYGGVDYASIEQARRHNRRAKIIKRMR